MLDYARWKYVLVSVVTLVALLFAAPNFFGEDQALQVARKDRVAIDESARVSIEDFLRSRQVKFIRAYLDEGRVMVRFPGVAEQLQARDAVNEGLAATYVSALARASRAPEFFRAMGLRPMALGLDLRGGLHLLYQVDVNGAVSQLLDSYEQDFRRALTAQKLPFNDIAPVAIQSTNVNALRIAFPVGADVQAARAALQKVVLDMTYTVTEVGDLRYIEASMSEAQVRQRQTDAIQQNIVTLRNRVNELGVSEPSVTRQGVDRVAVQLPGVQNSAEVKDILGKVATLEFRLTDTQNSAAEAVARGRAPLGSKLDTTASSVRRCSGAKSLPRATSWSMPRRPPHRTARPCPCGWMRGQAKRCCARRAPTSASRWRWSSSRSAARPPRSTARRSIAT